MAKFLLVRLVFTCLLGFSPFQVRTAPSDVSSAQISLNARQSSDDDVLIDDFFIRTITSSDPVAIVANVTYSVVPGTPIVTSLKMVESQTVSSYTLKLYEHDGNKIYAWNLDTLGDIEHIGGGFKRQDFVTSLQLESGRIYVFDKIEVTIVTNVKTVDVTSPGPFIFVVG